PALEPGAFIIGPSTGLLVLGPRSQRDGLLGYIVSRTERRESALCRSWCDSFRRRLRSAKSRRHDETFGCILRARAVIERLSKHRLTTIQARLERLRDVDDRTRFDYRTVYRSDRHCPLVADDGALVLPLNKPEWPKTKKKNPRMRNRSRIELLSS